MTSTDRSDRPDTDSAAWAYLAMVTDGPNPVLNMLATAYGPRRAADMIETAMVPDDFVEDLEPLMLRAESVDYCAVVEATSAADARIVTRADRAWPARLSKLLAAEPFALWTRGPVDEALTTTTIGVVSGDNVSGASTYVGRGLASDLITHTRSTPVVTSSGIGRHVLDGARQVRGPALLILPHGIDMPAGSGYEPGQNVGVITEYPPQTAVTPPRADDRDRLVAALSDAVVITQSGKRSSAINTMGWAQKMGVEVGGVPGLVTDPFNHHSNELIRDGVIRFIMSAHDAVALTVPAAVAFPSAS